MSEVQRLAAELAALRSDFTALARERRLANSSMEGGAIPVYQPGTGGIPGVALGQQYDGTYAQVPLGGPVPPAPSQPSAMSAGTALLVRWDGAFAGDPTLVAPQDFSRVEVHVGLTADLTGLDFSTLRGTIETPRGGEFAVNGLVPGNDYWVRLTARSMSGKFSDPSVVFGPVRVQGITAADIDLTGIGGNTIWRQASAPTGDHRVGDLWLQTPSNVAFRWEGDPGAWVAAADQRIGQAIDDAFAAQQSADAAERKGVDALAAAGAAQSTADGASSLAALAKSTADSKVTVYRQTAPPTGGTYRANDLWLDTDDNNLLYAWSGSAWTVAADQRIATALTNAGAAQTMANSKTSVFAQISAPTITGRTVGDLWFDTDDGNRRYVWSGSAWVASPIGAAGISATARQLGSVTTYRQSSAPTAGMIDSDLWIDSDDGKLYVYVTGVWTLSQDAGIQQALTAAGAAQTTANAKTTTYYQTSAPATSGRVTGDLWVDTDDGNLIYTWSGTAWAATKFAAQAITATARQLGAITTYRQATAPTAGMVANDLWIDSDDNSLWSYSGTAWVASRDAGIQQALTNAGTAQTTANAKTTVYYQTTSPATTGRVVGDLWVDTANGNRISTWNGTAWALTQFAAQAISATARQLGAITTYRQATAPASGMMVGDFWIDSDDNVIYRYEGVTPAWVKSQDVNINAAISAAATAQATADGKVRIFPQTSAPTGLTAGDVGDEWIDTDDANKIYTWALIAGTTYGWQARLLGNSAIEPKSLIARDLIATGTVSAALLETVMVLTNTLVVGDPAGDRVTVSGTTTGPGGVGIQQVTGGKVTFNLAPGGAPYFAGTMTGYSANFTQGSTGWSITEDGDASYQNLQVFESLTAQNLSVAGLSVRGVPIADMISTRPNGLVAQGFENTLSLQGKTAETGIAEIGFTAMPGRGYFVDINGPAFAASDAETILAFMLRCTTDGTAPNINSTALGTTGAELAGPTPGGKYLGRALKRGFLWYPPIVNNAPTPIRLALSFYRDQGTGTVGINCQQIRCQMVVTDVGPALPNSIRANNFTAAAPPPPPPAPVQAYDETFYTTWTSSYRQNGSQWSVNNAMYQGYGDSFNGNQASMMGFDLAYLRSRLAGANIVWAKLYARAQHTYNSAGAYAWIGSHGNDAMPATYGGPALLPRRSYVSVLPGGWFEQDVTGIVTEMRNSTASGFMFGPAPDNGFAHYAYFYGQNVDNKPRIVVHWEK